MNTIQILHDYFNIAEKLYVNMAGSYPHIYLEINGYKNALVPKYDDVFCYKNLSINLLIKFDGNISFIILSPYTGNALIGDEISIPYTILSARSRK